MNSPLITPELVRLDGAVESAVRLGVADAVADVVETGSTLRQAGLEVFGISLVTNLGAGISETPLSHAEVVEAGQATGPRIARLLADIVGRL